MAQMRNPQQGAQTNHNHDHNHHLAPQRGMGLASAPMNAFSALLKIAVGAGVMLVGAYALSRQHGSQASDGTWDRLQQLITEAKSETSES